MSLINKIQIIERNKIIDERGWFLKVINGHEENLPTHTGEIYLVSANHGESRAGHYHKKAHEWFTVIEGKALMLLKDIETNEELQITLDAESPQTVYVPSNIAHKFINMYPKKFILVAYSDTLYDASDTVEYSL